MSSSPAFDKSTPATDTPTDATRPSTDPVPLKDSEDHQTDFSAETRRQFESEVPPPTPTVRPVEFRERKRRLSQEPTPPASPSANVTRISGLVSTAISTLQDQRRTINSSLTALRRLDSSANPLAHDECKRLAAQLLAVDAALAPLLQASSLRTRPSTPSASRALSPVPSLEAAPVHPRRPSYGYTHPEPHGPSAPFTSRR